MEGDVRIGYRKYKYGKWNECALQLQQSPKLNRKTGSDKIWIRKIGSPNQKKLVVKEEMLRYC
jgi:hypothetical protein